MSEEIDHRYTHDAVCPHCGYKHLDSWEFDDSDEVTCHSCEKDFLLERITTVQYVTEKPK